MGLLRREQKAPLASARHRDEHGALGVGCIEHGADVGRVLLLGVERHVGRPVGPAVAAGIEGDHAHPPREVGNLRLPQPRVHDGPGGHEDDGAISLAVHLVEDSSAVFARREALGIRIAGPALLASRSPGGSHAVCSFFDREPLAPRARVLIQSSISESRTVWPSSMPESFSSTYPCAMVMTRLTVASSESPSKPYSRSAGAKASVSTRLPSSFSCWTRARSSGRFHAMACSSSQIFEYPLDRSSF